MYEFVFIIVLICTVKCDDCFRLNLLPMPKNISCDSDVTKFRIFEDPCEIIYHVVSPS